MAVLGFNDMKQFALPTGWDATELLKYQLAAEPKVSFEQVTNDLIAALQLKANMLLQDPIYGGMIFVTEEQGREYADGDTTTGMSLRGEYTKADPRRSKTIGHMWPLLSFDRTLGFTWDFLRKARQSQIDANMNSVLYDVEDEFQRRALTRFFAVEENTLGTSGKDVPFVKGAGVTYTPPPFGGKSFASTHTHFDRKTDDAAGWLAAVKEGAAHLWEHGIRGPWIGLVPFTDKANFAGLDGFVKPDLGLQYIQAASTSALTLARMGEEFFGAIETDLGVVQLHATHRLPANYFGMYKSYGSNNPRNPLAVRVAPDLKFGPLLMAGPAGKYPLQDATVIHEYGVGVNERLNGYAVEFDSSGSYASPTIS